MPTYQFPLEEQTKYPGRIIFTVVKTTGYGIELNDVQSTQANNSVDKPKGFVANVTGAFSNLKNATVSGPKETVGRSVSLYLPAGVQVQDGVVFNNVDLGMRGATAFDNAGDLGTVARRIAAGGLGEINQLTEALRSAPNKQDIAKAGASFVAGKAGQTTGAIVSSALQVTTNPNTRAVFQSVPLREFTFSFKMLPQSMKEAQEIIDIVQMFREEIYPETIKIGEAPVAYKFPNKFKITMLYGRNELGIMILPSYLVNMSTTYNGSSQSFYRDGKFSEIDLTLTMRESRTLSKEDITNGTGITGVTNTIDDIFDQITTGVNNAIDDFIDRLF